MSKYIYLKESDEVAGPVTMTPLSNIESEYYKIDGAGLRYLDKKSYHRALKDYDAHIASLPRYKVTGTHSWSDQQLLEEGMDLGFVNCNCKIGQDCPRNPGKWLSPCKVAIPIKSASKAMSELKKLGSSWDNIICVCRGLIKDNPCDANCKEFHDESLPNERSKEDKQKELEQAVKEYIDRPDVDYYLMGEIEKHILEFYKHWQSNQQTPTPSTIEQGQFHEMNNNLLLKIFKEVSLIDLSRCEFEYGKDEDLLWINAISNGRVVDSISYNGNIFLMMNNDGSFSPLNPMKQAFDIWDKAEQGQQGDGWISVENRPLFTTDEKGNWYCTEDGEGEFIAAVPYNDKKRPNEKNLWWVKHCVIEDAIGLCVVGDDSNEPAGWDMKDITYYLPFPKPPIK